MDRELRKRIEDFFEGYELVEYLQIPVEDVVDAFEDQIEEVLEDVEEYISFGTRGSPSNGRDSDGDEYE